MKLRIFCSNPENHEIAVCNKEEITPSKLWVVRTNSQDTPEQAYKRNLKGDFLSMVADTNSETTEEDIAKAFKQIDNMIIEFV